MARGFLQKYANQEVKMYLKDGMVFEAFILLIREAETTDEIDEIEYQAYKEFEVKCRNTLTEDELGSIEIEAIFYRRDLK